MGSFRISFPYFGKNAFQIEEKLDFFLAFKYLFINTLKNFLKKVDWGGVTLEKKVSIY